MIDKKYNSPHDAFFHGVFSNKKNMCDFLEGTLPEEISSLLGLKTITYDTTRYVEPEMQNRFSDLVVKTSISPPGKGVACNALTRRADIYFLFEHKSYNDPHTWLQIMRYQLLMWEKDAQNKQPLRLIIPYIFYHGKNRWILPENFAEQFVIPENIQPFIPHYKHLLFNTKDWSDSTLENSSMRKNIYLITSLMLMKHIFHLEHEMISKIFALWRDMEYINERDLIIFELMYISNVKDFPVTQLDEDIKQAMLDKEQIMPTLAERLEKQGAIKKQKTTLIKLLELKYGLTAEEINLINSTDNAKKLDKAVELVVTADTKDAVLGALN